MNKSESYALKRLNEQIKFFGAKPKRFVSIYGNKPRIRVSNKSKESSERFNINARYGFIGQASAQATSMQQNQAIAIGAASHRAAMAQQIGAQQAFAAQRDMFMQQQVMQVNAGVSNIGQSQALSRNSLTGGLAGGLFGYQSGQFR